MRTPSDSPPDPATAPAAEAEAAGYPPAPWRLHGASVAALCLVAASEARRFVPPGLSIVSVWPGRTVAVLYCARYEAPSPLCYHELIVAPALVASGGRVGFWISHIHVDDPLALAGGREIWSLPKERAGFSWGAGEVAVRCGSELLCRIRWQPGAAWAPIPLYLPVFTRGAGRLRFFSGAGSCQARRCRGEIVLGAASPLPRIGLDNARSLWLGERLQLSVRAPRDLG